MKRLVMTQVIVDSFHRRREKQLRYLLRKEAKLRRQGRLIGGTNPIVFTTIYCKGCRKEVKVGEGVLELPIGGPKGGAMYVHDNDGCVSKFKEHYKRMAYLVKDYEFLENIV